MPDSRQKQKALATRILEGPGHASPSARRSAFDNRGLTPPLDTLVDKVATHADRITDEDFAAARQSGLSEDQLFEIVVCAAIGLATRQVDSARAALAAASGKESS